MKKNILWMLATILVLCGTMSGFAQNQVPQDLKGIPGTWTFIAKLSNPEDTIIVVPTDDLKNLNEVVKDGNGAFLFTTNLTETKSFLIVTPSLLRHTGGFSIIVEDVPGEVLTAQGLCERGKPADGLTFSGSKFYGHYTEAYTIKNTMKEAKNAQQAIDFIKAHPNEEVTATLVGSVGCYATDRFEEYLALLSPEVRNGRLKSFIDNEIEEAKAYVRQMEMENKMLKAGSKAPDFTLNDINGQPLTLSSLYDKILVLDFWGSWCTWCIKGFPEMKKYYEKYKDKLEILGMDCNDTEVKWKKAVADHELPWKHVYVPKGSKLLNDYMITGFPTKIIIANGTVLKTIVGESPEFYELLDTMFEEE